MISGSFYTILGYISPAEMLVFVIFVCNYLWERHVTAATWPCTYLFLLSYYPSQHCIGRCVCLSVCLSQQISECSARITMERAKLL